MHYKMASSMPSQNLFRIFLSLLFISVFVVHASKSTTTNSLKVYKSFIKMQCNSTTYPNACYKSLSPYASTVKTNRVTLTKMAVNVALKAARIAYSTLTNVANSNKGKLTQGETSVFADCRENIDDTVDLLKQSVDGLVHLNGTRSIDERFLWDTIKTWMSAAITDESTCTDELGEIHVRPLLHKLIQTTVSNVARINSNALALVNRLSF
ncbi:hypothetical protein RJT34_31438 [Clitoria ternatea]|uniref:Pectinesterase inhibitor domain-containing protein n=1 Tax=Clitoria ternatea TaxID=43366 RepID=A0AAN9EV14_CLITE